MERLVFGTAVLVVELAGKVELFLGVLVTLSLLSLLGNVTVLSLEDKSISNLQEEMEKVETCIFQKSFRFYSKVRLIATDSLP